MKTANDEPIVKEPLDNNPCYFMAHHQPVAVMVNGTDKLPAFGGTQEYLFVDIVINGTVQLKGIKGSQVVRAMEAWTASSHCTIVSSGDYKAIRIFFDEFYLHYCLYPLMHPERRTASNGESSEFSCRSVYELQKKIYAATKCLVVQDWYTDIIRRHLLHQLILDVAVVSNVMSPKANNQPLEGSAAREAFSYFMEANYTRKLTVQDLADATGQSVSSFKRFFATNHSMTPIQWLINRRLEYAYFLLFYQQYSVNTAAIICGFGELTHFVKSFRRKFGFSPGTLNRGTSGEIEGCTSIRYLSTATEPIDDFLTIQYEDDNNGMKPMDDYHD